MSYVAPTYRVQFLGAARLERPAAEIWGLGLSLFVVLTWTAGVVLGFKAALAVLTVVGFAAAIGGLKSPVAGLLGVGILCTLDAMTRSFLMEGGLLRWNTFNYWLLIVMALGAPILLRLRDAHSRILQMFIGLLIVEMIYSPRPSLGFFHVLNIVILFGLMVYLVRSAADDCAWYWLGIVNGLVGAGGGLVYFLHQNSLPKVDANALAHFPLTAIMTISLVFPFAGQARFGRLYLGLLAIVNCCWVFLTGSRGALLVALFALGILVLRIPGWGRRAMVLVATAGVALAVITQFPTLQDRALHRIDKTFDTRYSAAGRTSGRFDLALAGWRIFLENPLGVGTGGFAYEWAHLEDQEGLSGFQKGREFSSHTPWMKTLAENGIPGFILFVSYLGSFAVVGWRKRRQGMLLVGLLATGCLSLAFLSTEFQAKGLWLLAAGSTVLLQRESLTRHHRMSAPAAIA